MISQGIDQPFYGAALYGSIVYDSAYPAPPSQAVGWPEFYGAISNYLESVNVFRPGLSFWAIDPDSVIQWPSGPSPFGLIVPGPMHVSGDDIGGGRFSKLWVASIDIHIVVGNAYDTAFQDTQVVTSPDLTVGPFALIHLLIDKMEQAYIVTASRNYATVESPRAVSRGALYRFKQTSAYVSVPITFEMLVLESLPSTLIQTAMPPSIYP